MSKEWLIFDVNFLAWRSFFSVGHREAIPSILLTISEVMRIGERFNTLSFVFAFDTKPYLRKTLLPAYKASRETKKEDDGEEEALDAMRYQIRKLNDDYLTHLGHHNSYSRVGYEADDIIAAVVAGLPEDDHAIIVSTDQDLYQLLSPRVSLYKPITNEFWTSKRFREFTGIHPLEWAEAKALTGCSTDEIPGIHGVALPTACKYLCGDKIPPNKLELIREFVASPDFNRNLQLTTLPFAGLKPITPAVDWEPPHDAFRRLCKRLDMESLADSVDGGKSVRRVDGD